MSNNPNEVLAQWETSSQYWNKYQAIIEEMFAPMSHALIEEAQIGLGHKVLDIGGGSGEPSFTIATAVGDSGSVTYTDPAAGMLKSARDEATHRGIKNIQFHQTPAESLPFANDTFDAVVGRLSTMFFSDALAGLREMLRVVKPGRTVSLLVWSTREVNPFFSIVSAALDRFVPPEPEGEDAPTAFRFSAPGKLAKLFREAGAADVKEKTLRFTIGAPIAFERFWELRSEMSDSFRKKLATLEAHQVQAIKDEVQLGTADYFDSGEMKIPGEVLIVSASK
jgi:ubiquinone/menaquinone biosynthesis C-methylase UbiE